MSDQYPRVPTNLEQQHKLAKDLLHDARNGDPAATTPTPHAVARRNDLRPSPTPSVPIAVRPFSSLKSRSGEEDRFVEARARARRSERRERPGRRF